MKKIICIGIVLLPALLFAQPCTVNNGAGCLCADGSDTCILLPDLTISWFALQNYSSGPDEFSQSGNGADDGRLKITGSTPNIGRGPFTVMGTNYFVCGPDTIYSTNSNVTCPDGSTPSNLLHQRVYSKQGNTVTYEDYFTGAQTYHPSHGHNHVDDWVVFTLRMENPSEPDTLKWPIVGNGSKLGFCLMDYGSCNTYNGHCRDRQTYGGGIIITSANIANFGMGGGGYSCSPVEQGISVGYTDIYDEGLDGMWINIPPNTCNGNYWIVAEVDPRNSFRESNENNNWTAIPFTLTKQTPIGGATAEINVDGAPYLCNNVPVLLEANPATSYLWSTGDTTRTLSVTAPGDYYVQIASQCGNAISDTVTIPGIAADITYMEQDSVCVSGAAQLSAQGPGFIKWYDAPSGGNPLDTGMTFITPPLQNTATYYVENVSSVVGAKTFANPHDHTGISLYSTFNGYIIFDCLSDFVLKTVKVYTDYPGNRTIELRNSGGTVLQSATIFINQGTTRIALNFPVSPGTNYQLGTNGNDNNANFGHVSPDMRRSGTGVNYPYVVNGVLSLNDSPYGQTYYYYFYDWEIETGSFTCTGPRQPVTAVVLAPPSISIPGLGAQYYITDAPVVLTGQPAGGTFTIDGIGGNIFDPATAGLGVHSVSYSYTDEYGCSNIETADVTVISLLPVANAGSDISICSGETATLNASGGAFFSWNTGETSSSISVSPTATTIFSVTVSDGLGNQDDDDVSVTVNDLPVVTFTGLAPQYDLNESPVTLAGNPSGGIFSGTGISGNTFDPSLAGVGGPYEIVYTFEDVNGCENSVSEFVTVTMLPVGIANHQPGNMLNIFPNPTNGEINIEFNFIPKSDLQIRVHNSIGKLVVEEIHVKPSRTLSLNFSGYSSGIYVVEIIEPGESFITKFVKN